MVQVTVGVPAYNNEDCLERSLTCLRDQTCRDFEALIFDDCSRDGTPEIAKRFCAADPRFRYARNPQNLGMLPNFRAVLEAAQTPYFMWRAADDTSDLNYIETLLALLKARPDCDLAVPRIVSALPDGTKARVRPVSMFVNSRLFGPAEQVFRQRAAWMYGLYRREAICKVMPEVMAEYPYLWGWDPAALLWFGLNGKIAGTNATTFYQQRHFRAAEGKDRYGATGEARIEMVQALETFAHRQVDRYVGSPFKRRLFHFTMPYFGHKRGYPFRKRLTRWLRRLFSNRGQSKRS